MATTEHVTAISTPILVNVIQTAWVLMVESLRLNAHQNRLSATKHDRALAVAAGLVRPGRYFFCPGALHICASYNTVSFPVNPSAHRLCLDALFDLHFSYRGTS